MASDSHAGKAKSWLAVVVMWIGFIVGGVALVPHPKWVMFWVAVAIVAVGGIFALAVHIFDDVIVDEPRVLAEQTHFQGILHGRAAHELRGGTFGETSTRTTATDPSTNRYHG